MRSKKAIFEILTYLDIKKRQPIGVDCRLGSVNWY